MGEKIDFEEVCKGCYIVNDDSLKALESIEEKSVDLILTDPPYNLGKFMHKRATNMGKLRKNHFSATDWDHLDYAEWTASMDTFLKNAAKVIKVGGAMIIFMSLMKTETIIQLAEKHGFYYKTVGVWHKKNPIPRNMNLQFINSTEGWIYFTYKKRTGTFNNEGKALHDFFETGLTPSTEKSFGGHPTQKPEKLLRHLIILLSNKNDTILDPFMGSGSTGKAAKDLGRKFIGIELSKEYFNLSRNKLINATPGSRGNLTDF